MTAVGVRTVHAGVQHNPLLVYLSVVISGGGRTPVVYLCLNEWVGGWVCRSELAVTVWKLPYPLSLQLVEWARVHSPSSSFRISEYLTDSCTALSYNIRTNVMYV